MRRASAIALAVTVATLVALAVAPAAGAATKVLRVGIADKPESLNPFVVQDLYSILAISYTWRTLLDVNPADNTARTGLAAPPRISRGGTRFEYRLRPGLRWSDGRPLTSRDVKYSLDTLGQRGIVYADEAANTKRVSAPDPRTVVIDTRRPDARLEAGPGAVVLPSHIWSRQPIGALTSTFQPKLPLVGSGPFVVRSLRRGRSVRMVRNTYFAGKRPIYDEIQLISYASLDAVERALGLGEIDVAYETSTAGGARLARGNSSIVAVDGADPTVNTLAFNLCSRSDCPEGRVDPPLQDVRVRRAIAYAIDRQRINDIVDRDTAQLATGMLPPYYARWYVRPAQQYGHDPAQAARLLDEAGWTRDGNAMRTKSGTPLALRILAVNEGDAIQTARLVREQLRAVGIDATLDAVSFDRLIEDLTRMSGGKPAPAYDVAVSTWSGGLDPGFLLELATTNQIGGLSDTFYSNPVYDRLHERQIATLGPARRKALIGQQLEILQRDLPYIALTFTPNHQAYRTDRVDGLVREYPRPSGSALTIGGQQVLFARPAGGQRAGNTNGLLVTFLVAAALTALSLARRAIGRQRRGMEALEL